MLCYKIDSLCFSYPGNDKLILNKLCLDVFEGELIALCGPSGCGKSTLLRRLKPELSDAGNVTGKIDFYSEDVGKITDSSKIGFVMQDPAAQLKYDTVFEELMRYIKGENAMAVCAETACFFGIQGWLDKKCKTLSGGQKQLVNLASVMASSPSVLILDEPTSQLDPIAASEFIAAVGRINRELGTTVIMVEHRLEEVLPLATRAVIMDNGEIIAEGSPRDVGLALKNASHSMYLSMPTAMHVFSALSENDEDCPISVRDGRIWLEKHAESHGYSDSVEQKTPHGTAVAVSLKNVWFRYTRQSPDVLCGADFTAKFGEITALVGGNGTGKSTTAGIISGKLKPYRGAVTILPDDTAYLPQDPLAILTGNTVYEALRSAQKSDDAIFASLERCGILSLSERTCESLSGGEKQRAALAKIMLTDASVYLFDEPTKGLDAEFKEIFAGIIKEMANAGKAVILISHDLEFCSEHADRCAMLFDGWVVAHGQAKQFFAGNSFYTTSASRMARKIIPDAVTANDIINAFSDGK